MLQFGGLGALFGGNPPVATGLQLSKLLLTGYQFSSVRIPIEYAGRVTRCSISSFVTAGLWPRSGYRGGRVSEAKVMN